MPKLVRVKRVPSRFHRPPKDELPKWQPGITALRILQILLRYRYLTPSLIAMVYEHHHGRGQYEIRRQLTNLWRHEFVERHVRPSDLGSKQMIYTLSVKGAHQVVPDDDWPSRRRTIDNLVKRKAPGHYDHALAVATLKVLWDLGSRGHELFETELIWHDKEGWGGDVVNRFEARVRGQRVRIDPDLTVLIGHKRRGYYRPYFFEIERSHRNSERLERKLRAYAHLLGDGHEAVEKVFSRHARTHDGQPIVPEPAVVVYVCSSPAHAERIRDFAGEIFPARDADVWFTSLEQLHEEYVATRKDGQPFLRLPAGSPEPVPVRRTRPIAPADFFTRPILTAIDGRRGVLVV